MRAFYRVRYVPHSQWSEAARQPPPLPDKTQGELDVTIIGDGFCYRPELGRVERSVWNLKLRRVHHIEKLRPEL